MKLNPHLIKSMNTGLGELNLIHSDPQSDIYIAPEEMRNALRFYNNVIVFSAPGVPRIIVQISKS